ncbi:HesA/MoeB/ThiF family protein [candidate division FCPU426 bacterium]|nr:HesA/MoeB/ThiF family protein [candidate division FCPU426 bacterium]
MPLGPEVKERYQRQLLLPEIGETGQSILSQKSVLIIGIGGLGSPAALYLAAAGIGCLGLVDGDRVELSNLHRQIIHFTPDVGKKKVLSAKEKINQLNPAVQVKVHPVDMQAARLTELTREYHFIIDATDSFSAKYMISDACVRSRTPFCHAGITGFSGQMFTYLPDRACGCFRCLFPQPPAAHILPDRVAGGVFGSVPGTLGTLQAAEAIKYLLSFGELLFNRLLVYDAKRMSFRFVVFGPSRRCPWRVFHGQTEGGRQAADDERH